ncbi:GtrA family protein [Anoxybacillus suryakundensis]|uniref:Putative flippase GtrA (Transmembrane translocase of bactoprenol-linked glucose) n=1 Tax=Anoxybacillus suryakundensis TaxID=1325335 RepID=A0A0K6GQ15_9BACL|nr:GtrA family protein [Anoxybacillus suryakundensis]CUA80697.1 Putative flippase GtrA (transmembrane translocase of bactoprenol-linked glucose) [Anoxybacillus suryakundensis]
MTLNNIVTFFRFIVVGVSNTLVDFFVFFSLVTLGMPYMWAQIFGYSVGVMNSYIWNRSWTFRAKGAIMEPFFRFLVVNVCSLMVTIAILHVCKEGLPIFWGKMIATMSGIAINWFGIRMWVFSTKSVS